MNDQDLNVETLHQKRKQMLIELGYELVLSKHIDNGGEENYKKDIKAFVSAIIPNDYCLGLDYWSLWRYQRGDLLELSILREFGIKRQFQELTLTDEQLLEIGGFAFLAKTANYDGLANFLKKVDDVFSKKVQCKIEGKTILMDITNLTDVVGRVAVYYKIIPVKLGYATLVISRKNNTKRFWASSEVMCTPPGFLNFDFDENGNERGVRLLDEDEDEMIWYD